MPHSPTETPSPLFRAENRLAEFPGILMIEDFADFSLFRRREELKLSGIVCPTAKIIDLDDDAAQSLIDIILQSRDCIATRSPGTSNVSQEIAMYMYEGAFQDTYDIPPVLEKMIFKLKECYDLAIPDMICNRFLARVNSDHPVEPHIHHAFAVWNVRGATTIVFNEKGDPCPLPPGLAAIEYKIPHNAPARPVTDRREDRRLTLIHA